MNKSSDCLKKTIIEIGNEWKEKLSAFLKNGLEELTVEEKQRFADFIDTYRESFVENRLEDLSEIEKIIDNDLLFNELKKYVDDTLSMYYVAEPLRVLEIRDYELAKQMVDSIFEQMIVRYNPDFKDRYEDFGFCKEEDFVDIINVLDFLSFFAVQKNLYKTSIVDAIYKNARFSKKLSQYIGGKIDKNFEQIRMRMIIEKLYNDQE